LVTVEIRRGGADAFDRGHGRRRRTQRSAHRVVETTYAANNTMNTVITAKPIEKNVCAIVRARSIAADDSPVATPTLHPGSTATAPPGPALCRPAGDGSPPPPPTLGGRQARSRSGCGPLPCRRRRRDGGYWRG